MGAGSGSGSEDTADWDNGKVAGGEGRKPKRSRSPAHALRMRSREARPAVRVGRVNGFDPGFDLDLYWCSGLGQMEEGVEGWETGVAGGFEHLERLADQDQSSGEFQKSRKTR